MAVVETQEQEPISASASKKIETVSNPKSNVKYFKAFRYGGMKFQVKGAVDGDPTTQRFEKFIKRTNKVAGYDVSVGYLATSTPSVIASCKKRGYVAEIDKTQYENAVGK